MQLGLGVEKCRETHQLLEGGLGKRAGQAMGAGHGVAAFSGPLIFRNVIREVEVFSPHTIEDISLTREETKQRRILEFP